MKDIKAVRRLALSLPEVEDRGDEQVLHFYVGGKQFAWTYSERVHQKRPREPRPDVLAVRCVPADKPRLLAQSATKFFTDDHYNGFPAVLVRLTKVDARELKKLLTEAWKCQAPRALRERLGDRAV